MKKLQMVFPYLFIIFIFLTLAGCAEKNESERKGIEGKPIEFGEKNKGTGYVITKQCDIPKNDLATILDNRIILAKREEDGWNVISVNRTDGSVISEEKLSSESFDGYLTPSGRESAYLLLRASDDARSTNIYLINGDEGISRIGDIELSDIPKSPELPFAENIVTTNDGVTYAWYKVNVLAKDTGLERFKNAEDHIHYDTNRIYVIDKNGRVKGFAHEPERIVMSGTNGKDFWMLGQGEKSWFLEKVDAECNLSERKEAVGASFLGDVQSGQYQFDGNELYYVRDNSVWKYYPATGANEMIMNLANFGMTRDDVKCFQVMQEGFCFVIGNGEGGAYYEIAQGETNRELLTVSGVGFGNCPELQDAVAEFNRIQENYQVELVDYLG